MSLTGNENGRLLTAIPDLIYPAFKWGEADYARLQARLDLYDDFVLLAKFRTGQVTEQYLVDPAELAAVLAGINLHSGLLPRDCLFWSKLRGHDRLGIYIPPKVWPVTIRNEVQAWRVPLPGLVFTGHEYDYSLWAVKDYPTDDNTPLYMAPCPNVHPEGVCRGSAPFPQAGPATIWHAVDIFFSSKFNRDLSNQKSLAHPDCVLDQWRKLNDAGADTYPPDDLVETNVTLRRLINVQ